MNYNLIPKSLGKQRLLVIKNITFYDLALALVYLLIASLISVGLVMFSEWIRAIVGLTIFLILSTSLINNRHYHLKGYQIFIWAFRFFAKKKQYKDTSKITNTNVLIPYLNAYKNYIETSPLEGGLIWNIGALEIKGFNISTLSYQEQQIRISELQETFRFLDCNMSLIKIDQPINNEDNLNFLKAKKVAINKLQNEKKISSLGAKSRIKQLDGYINDCHSGDGIIDVATTSKKFYLFIYHKKNQELIKYLNLAEEKINNAGLQGVILNKYQITNTIKALFNPFAPSFKNDLIDKYQSDLNHLLSFKDVKFYKDYFKINDIYYCISAVHDYPIFPRNGWGAQLAINNATMIWNISDISRTEVKNLIDKAINNATVNMLSVKKIVDKNESLYHMNAFRQLADALTSGEEVIKKCNLLFLNYGKDLTTLKAAKKSLEQTLRENNMEIDHLYYRQIEGFSSIMPKPTDPLSHLFSREFPAWTLASSFPFMNNALDDEKGLFMGFNTTGDLVVFDQFIQDYHRKNFNQLLLGTSGSGKSHTAKKQLNWHIANGRKVIVIDPEREYKNLCHYYDGKWVDVGNGIAGKINPLQILSSLDENETSQITVANYLQTLEHWFSIIIPDLAPNELRYLIQQINELYQKFNLSNNINLTKLPAQSFPTFDNLLFFLKQQNHDLLKNVEHNKIINIIALEFTGTGKYAQLYNGHSTLELNTNLLTVFDINSLFEKGNNKVIQAQLFLILAYIQNEVKINSFNEENEIIILIDEAHLIIDKDNPAGLNFMFQMVKRIRKRRGGIILITQNPDDFVGTPEIKKKTTAMMNNTQYTMVLNLSPQNLTDVMELFKAYGGLSETERNFIAKAKRGQGLFVVSGFNRHCIQVELSKYEIAAFNNENFIN